MLRVRLRNALLQSHIFIHMMNLFYWWGAKHTQANIGNKNIYRNINNENKQMEAVYEGPSGSYWTIGSIIIKLDIA